MAVISRYLWLTGHDNEANELVSHALERADAGFLATGIPPIVDTLLGLGRLDDLASLVPIANQQMEINALIAPTIERAEALLALESADTAAAAAKLRSAASRFDALSAPYEAARTREMLAELVADDERRELLAQALRAYEELDAAPRVRDLRAALEAQVVRLS
jgi:hypothetical protein